MSRPCSRDRLSGFQVLDPNMAGYDVNQNSHMQCELVRILFRGSFPGKQRKLHLPVWRVLKLVMFTSFDTPRGWETWWTVDISVTVAIYIVYFCRFWDHGWRENGNLTVRGGDERWRMKDEKRKSRMIGGRGSIWGPLNVQVASVRMKILPDMCCPNSHEDASESDTWLDLITFEATQYVTCRLLILILPIHIDDTGQQMSYDCPGWVLTSGGFWKFFLCRGDFVFFNEWLLVILSPNFELSL